MIYNVNVTRILLVMFIIYRYVTVLYYHNTVYHNVYSL